MPARSPVVPMFRVGPRRLAGRVLAIGAVLIGCTCARADTVSSGAWSRSGPVAARLLTAVEGSKGLKSVPAGLELKLDGDWKTYWRSPGDAGLPPTLDWKGSRNLASATLLYPAPLRIDVLGIQTFGYKHDVVFPLDLAVVDPDQPLDLKLHLDVLVCAEQCIPKTFDLALAIGAAAPAPTDDAQTLAKARAGVPGTPRAAGMNILSVEDVFDQGRPSLEVKATADQPFEAPDLIPEVQPETNLGTPRISLSADRRLATFDLPLAKPLPVGAKLTGRDVVLTLTDGARALETKNVIRQGASSSQEDQGPSVLAMLAIALLGGLILNLMPCVLPVLSLKFVSVVGHGGRAPGAVRAGFLATAAGVIVSFLAIAAALIAVKAAGRTVGWGIQFQEPAFIAAMAVLVTIFACHLGGLFEVPLPRFIARAASSRTGPDESLAGHFLTGAFATLLATPCSAPFLGTAVGFALAGSPGLMLGIFFVLGLGLALPYLVVAAVPRLATMLPRPGRWMVWLKQAMALPLLATAIWLVSILAAQAGFGAAAGVALLLVGLVGLMAVRGRVPGSKRRLILPAAAVLAVLAIALPDVIAAQVGRNRADANDAIAWTQFDRAKIRSLVSQGKTVFVDVTADWCLTCQANRRFVLSKDEIAKRLNSRAVSMQADWTRPNAEIGAYLASYGRYGIPFNIVYGPGAPGGLVLPELLTAGNVTEALRKASGEKAAWQAAPPGADRS